VTSKVGTGVLSILFASLYNSDATASVRIVTGATVCWFVRNTLGRLILWIRISSFVTE
jgi:hypothetical protein